MSLHPDTKRAISGFFGFVLVVGLVAVLALAIGEIGAQAGWWS